MKLINAISLAKECGLQTFEEMLLNVEIHSTNLFSYTEIDEELNELELELEDTAKSYGVSIEELLKWKIKEIENDL